MAIEVHPPTGSRRVLPLYLGPGVTIQVVVPRLGAFLGLGPRERVERAIRKGLSGKYLDSVVLVKNKQIQFLSVSGIFGCKHQLSIFEHVQDPCWFSR